MNEKTFKALLLLALFFVLIGLCFNVLALVLATIKLLS